MSTPEEVPVAAVPSMTAEDVAKMKAEKVKAVAQSKSFVQTDAYRHIAATSFGKRLHRRGWCQL